eukprot:Pompholyxophrys_sp_v1_NODE_2_length_20472_cov_5.132586.p7 type:complete len:342 gc:universal NODE_2_length_20472_cov_5.132586:8183-9208(+)
MKSILYLLTLLISPIFGYNVILYPGSHVKKERYHLLQKHLENRFQTNHTLSFQEYNPFFKYPNDTILIGHSFGATFSLIDAMRYPDKIKAVVLLNGHFNSRHKMMYPGIDQKNVKQPVLTILGTNDTVLPFWKAIDDLFYKNMMSLNNKFYLINEGFEHFTGLNDSYSSTLADQIYGFIENTKLYSIDEKKYLWFSRNVAFPLTIDLSRSVNVIDALLLVTGFPCWHILHYLFFLTRKPEPMMNYQFSNDVDYLLKTADKVKTGDVIYFLDKHIFSNKIEIQWKETILPTIHPSILVWLFKTPYLKKYKDQPIQGEIIVLPVNENVTYYKFPSRFAYLKIK